MHAGINIAPCGTFYINLHTNELNTKTQVAHEHHKPPFFSHLLTATEISAGNGMRLGKEVLPRESVQSAPSLAIAKTPFFSVVQCGAIYSPRPLSSALLLHY